MAKMDWHSNKARALGRTQSKASLKTFHELLRLGRRDANYNRKVERLNRKGLTTELKTKAGARAACDQAVASHPIKRFPAQPR